MTAGHVLRLFIMSGILLVGAFTLSGWGYLILLVAMLIATAVGYWIEVNRAHPDNRQQGLD